MLLRWLIIYTLHEFYLFLLIQMMKWCSWFVFQSVLSIVTNNSILPQNKYINLFSIFYKWYYLLKFLNKGDSEGLGILREKELKSVFYQFQIPISFLYILHYPQFQDSFTSSWNTTFGVFILDKFIRSIYSKKSSWMFKLLLAFLS